MKAKTVALSSMVLCLSSYTEAQSVCTVTTPICGEGSTLCSNNRCSKPPDGKCDKYGNGSTGCLDVRWNPDGCVDPVNICGASYCGSDCFCDNGTCIAVGEKVTIAIPTDGPIVTSGAATEVDVSLLGAEESPSSGISEVSSETSATLSGEETAESSSFGITEISSESSATLSGETNSEGTLTEANEPSSEDNEMNEGIELSSEIEGNPTATESSSGGEDVLLVGHNNSSGGVMESIGIMYAFACLALF